MTLEDMKDILKTTGFPVAYYQFKTPQTRPFIVYACDGDSDFMADNKHYLQITAGYIEIYTDNKDIASEKKVIDALNNNNIFYKKETEDFIDSEGVFRIRWSFSFI